MSDVLKMTGRNPETVEFGPFRLIPGDGLRCDGRSVKLPPRALAVLTVLVASPDMVVSKQTLMNAVWPDTFVTESSLLEAIGLLRDVLGDDRKQPIYIQTVHRRGYRFIGLAGAMTTAEAVALQTPPTPEALDRREALRPVLLACASYAVTTVCVAIVFAIFGHDRPEPVTAPAPNAAPQFAISHRGELIYLSSSGAEIIPAWTPSGLEIAFAFSKAGPFSLSMTLPADDPAPLLASPGRPFPTSWSADRDQVAFTEYQPMTGADIWVLDLPTRTRRPLARTWFDETWARFSPDGRWIAYMSNESGRWDVYVRSADGQGRRIRVSSTGGVWPSWSTGSDTIFFTAAEATMASTISAVPVLAAAAPVIVDQDGGRAAGRAELRVVLEWFSEITNANHRGLREHRNNY